MIKPLPVRMVYLTALIVWSMTASVGHALQLGKHRGAAVMGQPLNITVQATVDSADELAAGCVEAEVFYADSRVQKSRVRISTEKSAVNTQDAVIRIQSSQPIDEPVVTVYLRSICQQKLEKRYVVLADMLSEPAASASPLARVAPSQRGFAAASGGPSAPTAAAVGAAAEREARQSQREARRSEREARRAERVANAGTTQPAEAQSNSPVNKKSLALAEKAQKSEKPEKQTSRLKLEPLDLLAERDPALKSSAELRSAPSTDPAQRAAAAALWRAIAAQPEDILNDSQKLKTLESAVSALQVQMKQNQQGMLALDNDVKKAQAERFANPLVYGLALLLFLGATGLVWLLRKWSWSAISDTAVQPWWRRSTSQRIGWADSAIGSKSGGLGSQPESGVGYPTSSGSDSSPPASFLDLDLSDASASSARRSTAIGKQEAMAFKAAASMHRAPVGREASTRKSRGGFAVSSANSVRVVDAEELFDVQQQADFFVSLGQRDQAIEVLRLHIEDSEQTSALVYLDLLDLYHQTGQELEFEAFRLEFNARFNAEMPAFVAYSVVTDSEGLLGYPTAMSRIIALWPSPKVVTVIEESLFRQADSTHPTFDLEAYRELLLLYAVIKDILHTQASGKAKVDTVVLPYITATGPIGFGATNDFQADSAIEHSQIFAGTAVVPLTATVQTDFAGSSFDVDLDLTSDTDDSFKFEKVEAAVAQPPIEGGDAIDMLQTSSLVLPINATRVAADGNAIDFDIEQLPPSDKSAAKKMPKLTGR